MISLISSRVSRYLYFHQEVFCIWENQN